jgi:hypothetical protein
VVVDTGVQKKDGERRIERLDDRQGAANPLSFLGACEDISWILGEDA